MPNMANPVQANGKQVVMADEPEFTVADVDGESDAIRNQNRVLADMAVEKVAALAKATERTTRGTRSKDDAIAENRILRAQDRALNEVLGTLAKAALNAEFESRLNNRKAPA